MNLRDLLHTYWGHPGFKGSQEQIIESVLAKQDVLALLPTGGGKSICYQLPSMASEGICIVVSPLVALIHDQVSSLKSKGIKALSLTGRLRENEVIDVLDNCQFGNYKFLYLSPERLQQSLVQERIAQLDVNLLAVDEAHCISQWGNDFRPAYLQCAVLRDLQPETPMIALTATATREVAEEIVQNLKLRDCAVFKDSFLRDNIAYKVIQEENREHRLKKYCENCKNSGIVYVRTRRMAESIAALLNRNGCSAAFFHGGMPGNEKADRLKQWTNSKIRYMVATNAFGMGVDKADVRKVIHYQSPDSIESYYQEAGRAGRDGKPAEAILMNNPADESQMRKQLLAGMPEPEFLKKLYKNLNNYFQIPYGTGENSTHQFRFNAFCETYKLPTTLAYNGLQVLDQYSVVSMSQHYKRNTKLQFIAVKNQLWNYLEKHQDLAPLVQLLLRTYGGVFDYETKINTLLLAGKAGISEEAVISVLEVLCKDAIIHYQPAHGDLELTFLVPREDERTINRFASSLLKQQQVRIKKVNSMLAYLHNNSLCRSRQLLEYFGEKRPISCGKCDVCLSKKSITGAEMRELQGKILHLLVSGAHSSRELIANLPQEEEDVLKALQLLLEAGKITLNTTNQYTSK